MSDNSINPYMILSADGKRLIQFNNKEFKGSVTIPDSVTEIVDKAFYRCNITNLTIGNSVTSIGKFAFAFCENLKSMTIGNSVTSIGEWAFYRCENLKSMIIGNSVTSIEFETFAYTGLESASIPASVKSIRKSAFRGCKNLKNMIIFDSVKINKDAFNGCTNLKIIRVSFKDPNKTLDSEKTLKFYHKVLKKIHKEPVIYVNRDKDGLLSRAFITEYKGQSYYGYITGVNPNGKVILDMHPSTKLGSAYPNGEKPFKYTIDDINNHIVVVNDPEVRAAYPCISSAFEPSIKEAEKMLERNQRKKVEKPKTIN